MANKTTSRKTTASTGKKNTKKTVRTPARTKKITGAHTVTAKTPAKVSTGKKTTQKNPLRRVGASLKSGWLYMWRGSRRRQRSYMSRRPHRSFRMTRRREYKRSLAMPGYFGFTLEVNRAILQHKATFILLGALFFALTVAFGLLGSEAVYSQFGQLLEGTKPEGLFEGVVGEVSRAGLLLYTSVTTGLAADTSDAQNIAAAFFSLYAWLTVVWLLRNYVAGKKVKLRDGLYRAGAPILSTFMLFLVLLIQMVPAAIAVIVASAGWQSGFIQEGVASMAASLGLLLVLVLSLYWIVSTIFALIVVTLPGMYPFRALSIAGDLVIGRRLRLLYRIVWMIVVVLSWWLVILVPIILLDSWLKGQFEAISWMPIVPVSISLMMTVTVIWVAAYVYLLYRKVVDDDASPA